MKSVFKTIIVESQDRKQVNLKTRDIEIAVDTSFIVTLIGPRRSGKTYLL